MSDGAQSNDDAAAYRRDLSVIGRSHGLEVLSYILEMARLEAENATRQWTALSATAA